MMGQEAAMQARKTLFPILTLVLAVCSVSPGCAQDIFSDVDWASTKQEMKDFGMQYENAWDMYRDFEAASRDRTLAPDEVPDWSGLWMHSGGGVYRLDRDGELPRLKGRYAEMMQEVADRAASGVRWDPHGGCGMPRGYPGMLKNQRPHEFAVTPHQTWQMAQARNEVRRIYTDGRQHTPEDWAYSTEHGDTIGFWNGDKLVTHTRFTDGGWVGRRDPYLSDQLEATEIWQKVDAETIKAHVWLYDAEALVEPWYTTQIYSKMRQEEGSPLRLEYWWNCDDPNNVVVPTPEGGTTHLDFDFTDVDDVPE